MICRYHNLDCNNANENGYCKTSACVNPKFVVNIYPTDMENYIGEKSKAFHFEESRWQTGEPTEKGWYLCAYGDDFYCANYWNGTWKNTWCGVLLAWQKIEPYKQD